jgi:hypothetical protein
MIFEFFLRTAVTAVVLSFAVGFVYASLLYLKKHKRLFYEVGHSRTTTVNISSGH